MGQRSAVRVWIMEPRALGKVAQRFELPASPLAAWIPTQPPMADNPLSQSKRSVFFRRLVSTLGLWALVAAGLWSQMAWAYVGLVGILTLLSMIEYFQMLKSGGVKCFPRFGIGMAVAYCGILYWLLLWRVFPNASDGFEPPAGFDGSAVFIVTVGAFALQLRHPLRGLEPLQAVAFTILGFVYVALCFNFTARLVFLVPGEGQVPGAMMLLWLIAVTKFTDMGAYITGSMIGKRKMIPHVSPGKTWEGFFGALIFSQLAGCGLFALMPGKLAALGGWPHVIALGFILALLAVVGDLAESIVKRSLGAKDSGKMLPGIGGALDLIDSLCFTAPVLYFYLKWVTL